MIHDTMTEMFETREKEEFDVDILVCSPEMKEWNVQSIANLNKSNQNEQNYTWKQFLGCEHLEMIAFGGEEPDEPEYVFISDQEGHFSSHNINTIASEYLSNLNLEYGIDVPLSYFRGKLVIVKLSNKNKNEEVGRFEHVTESALAILVRKNGNTKAHTSVSSRDIYTEFFRCLSGNESEPSVQPHSRC